MVPGELKIKWLASGVDKEGSAFKEFYLQRGRSYFADIAGAGNSSTNCGDFRLGNLTEQQTHALFNKENYISQLSKCASHSQNSVRAMIKQDVSAFEAAMKVGPREYTKWASKEVGGDPRAVLSFFYDAFPTGKVIYLVREPRFIVRSIVLERKRRGIRLSLRQIIGECFEAQNVVNYAYEIADELGHAKLIVTYENLTSNTSSQIADIAEFLDIPNEPILRVPTTLGVPGTVATSSKMTNDVFQQPRSWKAGLTLRERMLISFFFQIAPVLYKLSGPDHHLRWAAGTFVRYSEILKRGASVGGG